MADARLMHRSCCMHGADDSGHPLFTHCNMIGCLQYSCSNSSLLHRLPAPAMILTKSNCTFSLQACNGWSSLPWKSHGLHTWHAYDNTGAASASEIRSRMSGCVSPLRLHMLSTTCIARRPACASVCAPASSSPCCGPRLRAPADRHVMRRSLYDVHTGTPGHPASTQLEQTSFEPGVHHRCWQTSYEPGVATAVLHLQHLVDNQLCSSASMSCTAERPLAAERPCLLLPSSRVSPARTQACTIRTLPAVAEARMKCSASALPSEALRRACIIKKHAARLWCGKALTSIGQCAGYHATRKVHDWTSYKARSA